VAGSPRSSGSGSIDGVNVKGGITVKTGSGTVVVSQSATVMETLSIGFIQLTACAAACAPDVERHAARGGEQPPTGGCHRRLAA
jgi:hypothetical protein